MILMGSSAGHVQRWQRRIGLRLRGTKLLERLGEGNSTTETTRFVISGHGWRPRPRAKVSPTCGRSTRRRDPFAEKPDHGVEGLPPVSFHENHMGGLPDLDQTLVRRIHQAREEIVRHVETDV